MKIRAGVAAALVALTLAACGSGWTQETCEDQEDWQRHQLRYTQSERIKEYEKADDWLKAEGAKHVIEEAGGSGGPEYEEWVKQCAAYYPIND
jgi:ABC-type glycerol-3-phosphate transport system substrate-binding protein